MTTTAVTPPPLRAAPDARPPGQSWQQRPAAPSGQPTLLTVADRPYGPRLLSPSRPARLPGVPDARSWGATLAAAVVQVVQGDRPIAQLTRWVDERPLAEVALRRRQVGAAGAQRGRPATLRSVRVQHPGPGAAEVCVHLSFGVRSTALALRLDQTGDRWLCTALELPLLGLAAQQPPAVSRC